MYLLKWSERIVVAAANMLNRGGETEKIALRKCIDEWCEYLEPELAEKERKKEKEKFAMAAGDALEELINDMVKCPWASQTRKRIERIDIGARCFEVQLVLESNETEWV